MGLEIVDLVLYPGQPKEGRHAAALGGHLAESQDMGQCCRRMR